MRLHSRFATLMKIFLAWPIRLATVCLFFFQSAPPALALHPCEWQSGASDSLEVLAEAAATGRTIEVADPDLDHPLIGEAAKLQQSERNLTVEIGGVMYRPAHRQWRFRVVELVTDPTLILRSVKPNLTAFTEGLLRAQSTKQGVNLESTGPWGPRVGFVTQVRLVNGELQYALDGVWLNHLYEWDTFLEPVEIQTDANKILAGMLFPFQREAVATLLEAQSAGAPVEIDLGFGDDVFPGRFHRGKIEHLRLINGVLACFVNGRLTHFPSGPNAARTLEIVRDPAQILRFFFGRQRAAVATLLQAQADGSGIIYRGPNVRRRGLVRHVAVEEGILTFDLDGHRQVAKGDFAIQSDRSLQGTAQ